MNIKLIAAAFLLISVGANIMLFKWHSQDQLQLEMMRHSNDLKPISNESSEVLSIKYQALKNKFITNDYNLRYHADNKPAIDVKIICDSDNGVNCVYFDSDKMRYYGHTYEV